MNINKDEFNWFTYTKDSYERQITTSPFITLVKHFSITDGELNFHGNICPNHAEIYFQVYNLDVNSVYECGFGAGQHLINVYEILRESGRHDIKIGGCDISEDQLDMGIRLFNIDKYNFLSNLQIIDFAEPLDTEYLVKYDFVFVHAATMHMSNDRCRKFLFNMRLMTNKYVFIIENIKMHDYNGLIEEIFPDFDKSITSKYIPYGILLTKK